MQISSEIPLLENIFSQWKELIADDYLGYRNHCYRLIHCCFALHDCTEEDKLNKQSSHFMIKKINSC